MTREDLPLTIENRWDDAESRRGQGVTRVTKIRYYLGRFGPFESSFEGTPRADEIEQVVRDKRSELERLMNL